MKNYGFSAIEVRRGHTHRNAELFESLHFQGAGEKRAQAVVGSEAVPGDRPASKGGEANGARKIFKFLKRKAAAISRSDEGADAGSGDEPNGNAFFFEDFEYADVSHASSKAATKRQ